MSNCSAMQAKPVRFRERNAGIVLDADEQRAFVEGRQESCAAAGGGRRRRSTTAAQPMPNTCALMRTPSAAARRCRASNPDDEAFAFVAARRPGSR